MVQNELCDSVDHILIRQHVQTSLVSGTDLVNKPGEDWPETQIWLKTATVDYRLSKHTQTVTQLVCVCVCVSPAVVREHGAQAIYDPIKHIKVLLNWGRSSRHRRSNRSQKSLCVSGRNSGCGRCVCSSLARRGQGGVKSSVRDSYRQRRRSRSCGHQEQRKRAEPGALFQELSLFFILRLQTHKHIHFQMCLGWFVRRVV